MKRSTALLLGVVLLAACPFAYALYSVSDKGTWPSTWPKELDPLRAQSKTLVGPIVEARHYIIPFNSREQFEAAWPHLLAAKSKGAPLILVHGPKTDFFAVQPAGVVIHAPPLGIDRKASPEAPIPGVNDLHERWMNTTYIELAVDGKIVDLNRIPLPQDTPIIDERFGGNAK